MCCATSSPTVTWAPTPSTGWILPVLNATTCAAWSSSATRSPSRPPRWRERLRERSFSKKALAECGDERDLDQQADEGFGEGNGGSGPGREVAGPDGDGMAGL